MYVLVEASSSKVFTLIARLPFLRITGTVRRAGKPVCVPSAVVVVCDLSACLSPGSRGGKRINHRRAGYFLPGGAVNHLPKKFFQVAQIFIQNSRTETRADATR